MRYAGGVRFYHLKERYRDALMADPVRVKLVQLTGSPELLAEQTTANFQRLFTKAAL